MAVKNGIENVVLNLKRRGGVRCTHSSRYSLFLVFLFCFSSRGSDCFFEFLPPVSLLPVFVVHADFLLHWHYCYWTLKSVSCV